MPLADGQVKSETVVTSRVRVDDAPPEALSKSVEDVEDEMAVGVRMSAGLVEMGEVVCVADRDDALGRNAAADVGIS